MYYLSFEMLKFFVQLSYVSLAFVILVKELILKRMFR